MKVITYCRVSTQMQADSGISLDVQEERCRSYAEMQGHEVVRCIRDEGVSGKSLDREGMRDLLAALESGEADGVVVLKIDRMSRRLLDVQQLVEDYFTDRFALISATEPIDTSSSMGRAMVALISVFAQMEREAIVERIKTAMDHLQKTGVRLGSGWYGHRHADERDDDGRKVIVPVPRELAALCRIYAMRAELDATYQEIAEELTRMGYPPPRSHTWHRTTIWRICDRMGITRKRRRQRARKARGELNGDRETAAGQAGREGAEEGCAARAGAAADGGDPVSPGPGIGPAAGDAREDGGSGEGSREPKPMGQRDGDHEGDA